MKTVLVLVSALSVVHFAAAQCNLLKTFYSSFVPSCDPRDIYIKWPNYQDPTSYYVCNNVYQPKLTTCPTGQYFIFVYQLCGPCQSYIPPVPCERLRTQYKPNCAATPGAFNVTSTAAPTTTTIIVTAPTLTTATPPATTTVTTTTTTTTTPATTIVTQPTTSPIIIMPPSPPTPAPDVPNPPTAPPTPPPVNPLPPTPPVVG